MSRWVACLARRFFFGLVLAVLAAPAQATIRYAVSVAHPDEHIFHVALTIPGVEKEVTVQLPAWNALYQIRDFAHHVSNLRAEDSAGAALPVLKLDKQTWRVTGTGAITVRYGAYWDEASPFSSQLSAAHAFINLATVLCYVPNRRSEDVQVSFENVPSPWRVAMALRSGEAAAGQASAAYVAANYDALVDAPVEIGLFDEWRVEGLRPAVRVVVHGDGAVSQSTREQITETLRRIVAYQTQLMRGAPYDEYIFLYHIAAATGAGGGGMEHANSTAIWVESTSSLPSITAHEFFHLWNVKRIRPASLEPVDYSREEWTRALWFAEGVTSTYGSFTMVRTGLWTHGQFYDDLAAQFTSLESRPARRWKSVEEASLDAWFEKYPLYRRPDLSISYYGKGQILGVLLDLLIRDATDNRASLDDVLRLLNQEFARRGRFYHDSADLRAAAERVAGRNLEDFFTRYVAGTEELPAADLLSRAGLVLKASGHSRADLGFVPGRAPDGTAVAQVGPGSAAERAGVREGDLLLELDGSAFPRNIDRWLRERKPGQEVRLRLRRDGQERELSFALGARLERAYEIEEVSKPTDRQRRIRDAVLTGATSAPDAHQ